MLENIRSKQNSLDWFIGINQLGREETIQFLVEDLANLLNSNPLYSEDIKEKGDMLITNYGLPSFNFYSAYSKEDQLLVSNILKESISRFEPRLKDLMITPMEWDEHNNITLHFKITANLFLDLQSTYITLESKFTISPNAVCLSISN